MNAATTVSKTVVVILLTAFLFAGMSTSAPATVEAGKLYTPQVKEARTWLKTKMPRKAFLCLNRLWHNESSWRVRAENKYSGAYGIPQALPGRKMRSYGKRWRTSAMIQVKWGRNYIKVRYGTMCKALAFQNRYGWY